MLYHCRMWCYAIGVEAVVLRSWCVILCTFMKLNHNKIIALSWYIFFTYIYDARSHLYQTVYYYLSAADNAHCSEHYRQLHVQWHWLLQL